MLKKLYHHLFCQPHMARRIPVLLLSVITMGMCIAFFEKVQVGTDPCTVFNLSVAQNVLHWPDLGRWQLMYNCFLLGIVLLLREFRYVGLGSLANMVLVVSPVISSSPSWSGSCPAICTPCWCAAACSCQRCCSSCSRWPSTW